MKKYKDILKAIASEHNTTPEDAAREMQKAIDAAFDNPDPRIQAQWKNIPHKGERPTPEDVISYIALALKKPTYLVQ